MPPRYAYWTILVDNQPTAFRASSQEDLMPTFNRLKLKHPAAKMMWWQNGKLWESRLDAQQAMHARGEMGRRGDVRQRPGERREEKLDWQPKSERSPTPKPPGARSPARGSFREGASRPGTQSRTEKLDWKPKGDAASPRDRKPRFEKPAWRPKAAQRPDRGHEPRPEKLDWKPKGEAAAPKRKWIPKEEFKKSQGIEARRDKNWRPGGEHKDPRQKYKDAKKAKWGRFKQTIRKRWESKPVKKKT
jgi:hypothetical protein